MTFESVVFDLSLFFISSSIICGIAYCLILIKELWQKHRGEKNE